MHTLTHLFDWLLAASLRASLLTLATLLIQAAWHRHLGARMRYALWLPVLIVLLMPVLPQSQWSIQQVFQTSPPPAQIIHSHIAPAMEPKPVVFEAVAPMPEPINWQRVLLLTWVGVSAGMLIFGSLSLLLTLRRFKQARHPVSAELLTTLAQIAREIHLRCVPQVLIASSVSSPAVTGLLRPTLLLPAQFDREFTPAEARLVLKHELMHLKRGDLPLNALMSVLMALHWFNPLLWIAFFKIRADREAACDAQVLHDAPNDHRIAYGHALLKVETAFCPRGLSLGFVGIFQRGATLRSRIHSIANHCAPHPVMKALVTMTTVLMTFFGITQAQQPAPEKKPTTKSIQTKLDKIIIPHMQFQSATVAECIEYLRVKAHDLDTSEPSSRGINLQYQPGNPPSNAAISLDLKEIPLGEALRYVVELANLKMLVQPYAVLIGSPNDPEFAKPAAAPSELNPSDKLGEIVITAQETSIDSVTQTQTAKGDARCQVGELSIQAAELICDRKAHQLKILGPFTIIIGGNQKHSSTSSESSAMLDLASGKLTTSGPHETKILTPPAAKIIIPSVEFRDATLAECIDFIRIKASELDSEKKGVNIVVKPGGDASAHITLSLKNVRLPEALRYCAELANHKLTSDAQSYFLTPVTAEDPAGKDRAASPAAPLPPSTAEAKAAELRKAPAQQYDFSKALLGDVLRFLATDARINFFALPDDNPINQKRVTFSIRASPFAVLESLCRVNGAVLVFDQDRWFIRAADDPEQIGKVLILSQTQASIETIADDPKQIGQAYVLPQTRASVETILKDISSILGGDEIKPTADTPKPSVAFRKDQNSVYVKATRLQHTWVRAYFLGLNTSTQPSKTK